MTAPSIETSLPVAEGTILAGKYRVDRALAAGGMGIVLLGRHVQLGQKVAIKLLRAAALEQPEVVKRFAREARAAARITSEHVVRVIDVGELDDGAPFMVMEYLEGVDLSQQLRDHGPLPLAEAVDYLLQACEALAEAHHMGIVHRDLKPANLFLTRRADGSALVKVLDFGISKIVPLAEEVGSGHDPLTQSSVMIGSPHYMSPEQLRSPKDVDARADVWALGTVLYRLITNRHPFHGETTAELCVSILMGSPRPARELDASLPAELDLVIARCLEKERDKRYTDIGELAAALAPFGSEEGARSSARIVRLVTSPRLKSAQLSEPPTPLSGARSRVIVRAEQPSSVSAHVTLGDSTLAPIRRARRPWIPILAGVSVSLVITLGAALALRRPPEAVSATPPPEASHAPAPIPPPATEPAPLAQAPKDAPAPAETAAATTTAATSERPAGAIAKRPPPTTTARPQPTAAPKPTATAAAAPKPTGGSDLSSFGGRK